MAALDPKPFSFEAEALWSVIPEPVLILSDNGKIERVNRLAEQIFNSSSEHLIGQSLEELLTFDTDGLPPLLVSLQSKEKNEVQTDFTHEGASESYRGKLKIKCFPTDEVHFLALVDHFHKTKEREREIQQLRAIKDRQLECLRQTNHDVNNSMTEMAIMISSIRSSDPGVRVELKGLARAVEYTKMITHSVSGEITEDQLSLNKVTFSPSKLLQRCAEIFSANAARKGITLSLNVRDVDRTFNFVGDSEKISRIVNNLIGNAIKFTPDEGRITITMEIKNTRDRRRADKQTLAISVSDSGPGIPDEHLQAIFTEGVQVGEKKDEGLGIGLSICREFTEAMKGKISVANASAGGGAIFSVELPLKPTCASPVIRCSSDPFLAPFDLDDIKRLGIRIAIADDSLLIRRSMQKQLSSPETGFDIRTVVNGVNLLTLLEEAQAEKKPFDVVITDLNMKRSAEGDPLEDGDKATPSWRMLEEINHWSHTFFIGLTADDTAEGKRHFKECGVDKVVVKGTSKNHFLQLIDRFVVQPRLQIDGSAAAVTFE